MSRHFSQSAPAFQRLRFCILFFLTLVGGVFISCNNNTPNSSSQASQSDSTSTDSTRKMAVAPTHDGVSFTMHNLYLPKKEFLDFFSHGSGNKALDLEFYFSKDAPEGSPTLGVWPTKGNHQFPKPDNPYIMKYAGTSFIDLPDNFFLGCNEFVPANSLKDSIEKGKGCPDACVLYFVPLPEEHLRYKVYLIPDSTTITIKASGASEYLKTLTSIAVTNPSPPRSATQ